MTLLRPSPGPDRGHASTGLARPPFSAELIDMSLVGGFYGEFDPESCQPET